jgi:FecR-like protein
MKRNALAAAVAALFASTAYANVARVDFAAGDVSAVAPDGKRRPLVKGSEVQVGETVSIQQGRAQLRFADGAYMSLQPGTEFKIEEFRFTGRQDGTESIVMHLLKGGMRTITGLIGRANRQNYKLRTEVATIGIRGTEFSVRYTDSIEVFCAEGAIFVQNEGGTVPLSSGEGARVVNVQTPATKTDEPPVLSPRGSPATEQKVDDPVNAIQDARPPLAALTAGLPAGTFIGNWAAATSANALADFGRLVVLDAAGNLVAFSENLDATFDKTNLIGTASAQSAGNDGIIAWGRWMNGTTAGDGRFSLQNFSGNNALHYVVGLPAANMPTTGAATYSMLGATPPTFTGSISSATLNSSSIDLDFGNSSAKFHIDLTVDGGTVSTKPGGLAITNLSGRLSGRASAIDLTANYSSKSLSVEGFLAGDGAVRAGMAYHFDLDASTLNGAIAYKKN